MNCEICGSSTFCTTSGITYCSECNSQIQDTQTETNVACSEDQSTPSVKKTPKDQRKEYSNWITAECFNHIIFMQVSSLIKLGASPKLKKTVLHIWSKYLQKCEIAFRTDYQAEDGGKPHLGPVPSRRDKIILYGHKQVSKRKRKISQISSASDMSSAEESNMSISDSASDTNSTASSVVVSTKEKYSCHTRKLYRKSCLKATNMAKYRKQVFNMALPKTISLCYLGLLYTEDPLALNDLIRFIYEDKVPYLNIVDKLPPSLKLQEVADMNTFLTYTVPDAYSILKTAREIAQFLKLPKFKEPCIFFAAFRFLKDLNLPDDINSIVKVLAERYEKQASMLKIGSSLENVPHDYQAVAFIIIALKLLFVLDGIFEVEHSRTMEKLNAIHPDNKYFIWNEWKKQMMLKEYLFLCENAGYGVINKLDSLCADRIISKCQFNCLKSPTAEDMQNPRDVLVLKHKIKDILSDIVSIPEKSGVLPTSLPLTNETNWFMQEWKTLPMYKETREIDFSLLTKDFTSSSLHFDPLQFDKEEEELSYLLMTSLYLNEIVPERIRGNFTDNFYQSTRTTSKYWFFNFIRSGKFDFSSDFFAKLSPSFKWLLNFMSKYTYCNINHLYKEVSQVEKVLFFKTKKIHSKSLSESKNNKIIVSL